MASLLKTDGITGSVGTTASISIDGNIVTFDPTKVKFPAGHVINVQQTFLSSAFTVSLSGGLSVSNITNLEVTITPKFQSSKFYLHSRGFFEHTDSTNENTGFIFFRNGTEVGSGDQSGTRSSINTIIAQGYYSNDASSTPDTWVMDYLDTPNTILPITYRVACRSNNSGTLYMNSNVDTSDGGARERGTSSLTVWEISGG